MAGRTISVLAALMLVLAGCMGGDDSDDSSAETPTVSVTVTAAPTPVTHRQFVKRLDRLCRIYNAKAGRFNKRYESELTSNDYAAIADLYRRAERQQAPWRVAVVQLEMPPSDVRRFRRYLGLTDRIDALFRRQIRALRREDVEEFNRLNALIETTRNQRTTAAVDLGLRVCGS